MGNKTCDFCGKEASEELRLYNEGGVNYAICNECLDKIAKHECINCGAKCYDEYSVYKGRCFSCAQLYMKDEAKIKLEDELGVNYDNPALYDSENGEVKLRFSQRDYEKWLTFNPDGRGFSEDDFRKSMFMRRIWIMLKLHAAGYTKDDIINENMRDIEDLLEDNLDKIIGQKCKFRIFEGTGDNKRALYLGEVIAHRGKVYLYEDN